MGGVSVKGCPGPGRPPRLHQNCAMARRVPERQVAAPTHRHGRCLGARLRPLDRSAGACSGGVAFWAAILSPLLQALEGCSEPGSRSSGWLGLMIWVPWPLGVCHPSCVSVVLFDGSRHMPMIELFGEHGKSGDRGLGR
jgi:hypothetical protein